MIQDNLKLKKKYVNMHTGDLRAASGSFDDMNMQSCVESLYVFQANTYLK